MALINHWLLVIRKSPNSYVSHVNHDIHPYNEIHNYLLPMLCYNNWSCIEGCCICIVQRSYNSNLWRNTAISLDILWYNAVRKEWSNWNNLLHSHGLSSMDNNGFYIGTSCLKNNKSMEASWKLYFKLWRAK